jgi:hypothetical protein
MADPRHGKTAFWILSSASLILYILISYLTPRQNFLPLIVQYTVLFGAFLLIYRLPLSGRYTDFAYLMGLFFRLSLLFLVPNLSDDVYRFIWDGRLTAGGINPYTFLPEEVLSDPEIADEGISWALYELFGKNTHSSYPPLNQLFFAAAAFIFPKSIFGSIMLIRLLILGFEVGNIILIRRLLLDTGKPAGLGLLYVLNPLVILELIGNLHFEGIMVFFLLLGLRYLNRGKFYQAGMALGLGILTKLLPLLLLPFLWFRFRKNGLRIILAALLITATGFLPFSGFLSASGFLDSLALYFYKLEFNASIYFLVRQVGYWIAGFNIIWVAGPFLGLTALLLIFYFSFSRSAGKLQTAEVWMWILMIYMAFTTTLHPWYIITPLALSLFTVYRFPLIWTFLIFLTYEGYTGTGYEPDYWLIGLEYVVVYSVMVVEILGVRALKNANGERI